MSRVYVFIAGLLQRTNPQTGLVEWSPDTGEWSLQAEAWCNARGINARSFNYAAGVVGALLFDGPRLATVLAADLRKLIALGHEIALVGHSNGCRIIAALLALFPEFKWLEIHLIAAWLPDDCNENGLNDASARSQIESLTCYVSAADDVLPLNLGLTNFGITGPRKDTMAGSLIAVTRKPVEKPYTHGGWVYEHFEETMSTVTGAGNAAPSQADPPRTADSAADPAPGA